jgi:hypothetical protein
MADPSKETEALENTVMTRDEEVETPAGQMAVVAARLVMHALHAPGSSDFFDVFLPRIHLIQLEARAAENELSQTIAATDEGKRLYLFQRGIELANAIQAAKTAIHDREHGKKK